MLFIPFLFSRLHLKKGREIISQQGSEIEIFSCQRPRLVTEIRTQKEIPVIMKGLRSVGLLSRRPLSRKPEKSKLLDTAPV